MKRFETHGGIDWCEYLTRDVEGAAKFYGEVLGWKLENMPMDDGEPYYVISVDGEEVGGIMKMPPMVPDNVPSHWGIYITVNSVEEVVEKTKASGGEVIVPPTDIPGIGRFSTLQDVQQGVFSVLKYDTSTWGNKN